LNKRKNKERKRRE